MLLQSYNPISMSEYIKYESIKLLFEKILKEAIKNYLYYHAENKEFLDAAEWIFNDSSGNGHEDDRFTSFVNICDFLNIDIYAMRLQIQNLLDNDKKYLRDPSFNMILNKSSIEDLLYEESN